MVQARGGRNSQGEGLEAGARLKKRRGQGSWSRASEGAVRGVWGTARLPEPGKGCGLGSEHHWAFAGCGEGRHGLTDVNCITLAAVRTDWKGARREPGASQGQASKWQ